MNFAIHPEPPPGGVMCPVILSKTKNNCIAPPQEKMLTTVVGKEIRFSSKNYLKV